MDRRDLEAALSGEPKAEEAIFWFCYAWHSGIDSDLYHILCESTFVPDEKRNFAADPEIRRLLMRLDRLFGPMTEVPYRRVRLDALRVGDVIISGPIHPSLLNRWPCRVFVWDGKLSVTTRNGILPLKVDHDGFVIGFRR